MTGREVEYLKKECLHPDCKKIFEVPPHMRTRIYCSHSCAASMGAKKRFEKQVYGVSWSHRAKTYYDSVPEDERWCGICGSTTNGKYRLYVDHDHETNEIRGLLCNRCNGALSWFELYADSAKEYLRV